MQIWHLTISSTGRRAIFVDEATRRDAVRCIVRIAGEGLLLFCLVDDHAHIVVICANASLPWLKGGLVRALALRCDADGLSSHATRVEHRAHLNRVVGYVLGQTAHHQLDVHPASWSGSCYQDLVGARCISQLGQRLRATLPRLRDDELHRMVDLPCERLMPASIQSVRSVGADGVARAAAAAFAVSPDLAGRASSVVAARRAAVQLGDRVGVPRSEMAHALRRTRQCVSQLARQDVDDAALRAIRLQLALEALLRESPSRKRAA